MAELYSLSHLYAGAKGGKSASKAGEEVVPFEQGAAGAVNAGEQGTHMRMCIHPRCVQQKLAADWSWFDLTFSSHVQATRRNTRV